MPAIVVALVLLTNALIPSRTTMYMMLGVRATDNFTQTEMGKKLEAYISQEMDNLLNRGKK